MVTLKLMNKIETLSDKVRAIEKVIHSLSRERERESQGVKKGMLFTIGKYDHE